MSEAKERKTFLEEIAPRHPQIAMVWKHEASTATHRNRRANVSPLKNHPDTMGILQGGRIFGIEFKTQGTKDSDHKARRIAQARWRYDAIRAGGYFGLAHTADEALHFIDIEPHAHPFFFPSVPGTDMEARFEFGCVVWATGYQFLLEEIEKIAPGITRTHRLAARCDGEAGAYPFESGFIWSPDERGTVKHILAERIPSNA